MLFIQVLLLLGPDLHTCRFHEAEDYGTHVLDAATHAIDDLLGCINAVNSLDGVQLQIRFLALVLLENAFEVRVDLVLLLDDVHVDAFNLHA